MTEYSDREITLEQEMATRGEERRRAGRSRVRQAGKESLTRPGQGLVRAAMGRAVASVEAWVAQQEGSGGQHPAYPLIRELPSRVVALLTLRACLDSACREATFSAAAHEVARRLSEERDARWLKANAAPLWQAAERRAKAVPERAGARLRRDAKRLARDAQQEGRLARWTLAERLRAGGVLVQLMERDAGMFSLDVVSAGRRRRLLLLRLLPEVVAWIADADRRDDALEPLYLPMLDVPAEWGQGRLGGYATPLVRREYLVKNRSKVTRDLVARAEMPAVYEAVNRLQGTAWEVNPDVLEVARALWDAGREVPGLSGAEPDPLPEAGDDRESWRRRFLARRGNLYRASRRAEAARVLWLAGRMAPEGEFYFPQQLDFRGRVYPVPQYLQPQGPDLSRGLLRFARGEWITLDCDGFWQHGANCLGLDKLPLAERRERMRAEAGRVLDVYRDPLACSWWQEAEEPWQFLAWCLEAGILLEEGRVLTRVPCYVDGTNNGLQILSLLLRDEVGGAATNCVPGEQRRDVYQDVADEVTRRLREEDDDVARAWLAWFEGNRMPRVAAKRPVMCLPYGCTRWSARQYVADWYEEERRQGRPPVGEPPGALVRALADRLWEAIRAVLGRAVECMDWLRLIARETVEAGVQPVWTTPSGFPARQSYTAWQTSQVRCRLGDRVRWVRHRRAGDKPSLRRHVNALPPNFVHSLDAAVLHRVVDRFDGAASTVHDSFGTTAGRLDELAALVREEYATVFEEDVLENLRQQLAAQVGGGYSLPVPPERGTLDPSAVRRSQYLFS